MKITKNNRVERNEVEEPVQNFEYDPDVKPFLVCRNFSSRNVNVVRLEFGRNSRLVDISDISIVYMTTRTGKEFSVLCVRRTPPTLFETCVLRAYKITEKASYNSHVGQQARFEKIDSNLRISDLCEFPLFRAFVASDDNAEKLCRELKKCVNPKSCGKVISTFGIMPKPTEQNNVYDYYLSTIPTHSLTSHTWDVGSKTKSIHSQILKGLDRKKRKQIKVIEYYDISGNSYKENPANLIQAEDKLSKIKSVCESITQNSDTPAQAVCTESQAPQM